MTRADQASQVCVVPTHDEPPLAAPGLLVCPWHHAEAYRILLLLPDLYDEMGLALKHARSPQAPAPEGARSQDAPAAVSSDVVVMRAELERRLDKMVSFVVVERKYTPPRNNVEAYVTFLARSAEWLSQHRYYAPEWYLTMSMLAKECQKVAYEARPAGNFLGPCPVERPVIADDGRTRHEVCGAPIRFDQYRWTDDPTYQIACPRCRTEGTLAWWTQRIVGRIDAQPGDHLTAVPLAMWLSWGLRRNISPDTVRKWKSRGALQEVGRDERNRPLYDRTAAEAHARKAYGLQVSA